MCSANTFKSAWRNACISFVKKDDHFFLVDINCYFNKYAFDNNNDDISNNLWNELKGLGYKCIGLSMFNENQYICINVNTKIYFSNYINNNNLGITYIGDKTISYFEFLQIHNIFNSTNSN